MELRNSRNILYRNQCTAQECVTKGFHSCTPHQISACNASGCHTECKVENMQSRKTTKNYIEMITW